MKDVTLCLVPWKRTTAQLIKQNTQNTVTTNIAVAEESSDIVLRLAHKNTVQNRTRAGFQEENQEVIKVGSDMR